MPVTNVRLKSCNVHGGMTARPSSRAAASIAASRRPFIRLQPDTAVMPVVVKTRLPGFALTLAISSRTSGGSGTTCARPFFVLLAGMFQVAPSSFSSPYAGDFVPPLARQQQYPEQRRERARSAGCQRRVDGFACPPKPADFVGGQHAIARLRPRGPGHTR